MNIITVIKEMLNLKIEQALGLLIVSLIIFFIPQWGPRVLTEQILKDSEILSIYANILPYLIGIILYAGYSIISWLLRCSVGKWLKQRNITKVVQELSEDEKSIISLFIYGNEAVLDLDFYSPAVSSLVSKGIIYPVRTITMSIGGSIVFPYALDDDIRSHIKKRYS